MSSTDQFTHTFSVTSLFSTTTLTGEHNDVHSFSDEIKWDSCNCQTAAPQTCRLSSQDKRIEITNGLLLFDLLRGYALLLMRKHLHTDCPVTAWLSSVTGSMVATFFFFFSQATCKLSTTLVEVLLVVWFIVWLQ